MANAQWMLGVVAQTWTVIGQGVRAAVTTSNHQRHGDSDTYQEDRRTGANQVARKPRPHPRHGIPEAPVLEQAVRGLPPPR